MHLCASVFVLCGLLSSCDTIDSNRVPYAAVNVQFQTVADWNVYGVAGAMEYQYFIRDKRVPSNFFYSASTYTGFGGVLLVSDVLGDYKAFDLACPVECQRDVRISIDTEEMVARCPKCGSTYNVFSLLGHPISGIAADRGYGLRRYTVQVQPLAAPYISIRY